VKLKSLDNLFSISLLDRSTTRPKTFDPVWNEQFVHDVTNARNINLTVFHDAALPPDDFVANCIIPFEDLVQSESGVPDLWVSDILLFYYIYVKLLICVIFYLTD